MAIYTNLPIYKAAYSLMLDVSRMMPNLSRDCRFSLGQDVRRNVMNIIIFIYRANRTRHKVPMITKMRETLLEVQVYFRLMCDLRYISENKFVALMEQTSDMSRQMVLWEKSEYKKSGGQNFSDD